MQERREVEPAQPEPEPDEDRIHLPTQPPLGDDAVDEVVAGSFPASDPPQWWAGAPD